MQFVKRAKDLGFSLDDVETLLHLADGGPDSCEGARELATEKIGELDTRIADLQTMRAALARSVQTCEQPRDRWECPILVEISGDNAEVGS